MVCLLLQIQDRFFKLFMFCACLKCSNPWSWISLVSFSLYSTLLFHNIRLLWPCLHYFSLENISPSSLCSNMAFQFSRTAFLLRGEENAAQNKICLAEEILSKHSLVMHIHEPVTTFIQCVPRDQWGEAGCKMVCPLF